MVEAGGLGKEVLPPMGDGLPLGAHPVGDGLHLWEPTRWAMGVEHALSFALQTIAHRVGS